MMPNRAGANADCALSGEGPAMADRVQKSGLKAWAARLGVRSDSEWRGGIVSKYLVRIHLIGIAASETEAGARTHAARAGI